MKSSIKTILSIALVGLCAYGLIAASSLWIFAKPTVKLGQVITISAPESNTNSGNKKVPNSHIMLLSGWAHPESWGAWSIDNKATLSLPKAPSKAKSVIIETRALVTKNYPEQTVKVLINGQVRTSTVLTKEDGNQIAIPLEAADLLQDRLVIEFELPNWVSPSTLGIGQDDRKLAIGLKSAQFQ